jgi:hypothetical protein
MEEFFPAKSIQTAFAALIKNLFTSSIAGTKAQKDSTTPPPS